MPVRHTRGPGGLPPGLVSFAGADYTIGVFLQANFGRRQELVLAGAPLTS